MLARTAIFNYIETFHNRIQIRPRSDKSLQSQIRVFLVNAFTAVIPNLIRHDWMFGVRMSNRVNRPEHITIDNHSTGP